MARLTYIVGGASSGKTRWAITFFEKWDDVLYMTIEDNVDPDLMNRINHNCEKHGIEWDIRLAADNLSEMVKGRKFSILNNLGAYTNRIVQQQCPDLSKMTDELRRKIEKQVVNDMLDLTDQVKEDNGSLLIISTELGCCPIPSETEQWWFRKILCNVNQRVAHMCDEAYMASSGMVMKMKGSAVG